MYIIFMTILPLKLSYQLKALSPRRPEHWTQGAEVFPWVIKKWPFQTTFPLKLSYQLKDPSPGRMAQSSVSQRPEQWMFRAEPSPMSSIHGHFKTILPLNCPIDVKLHLLGESLKLCLPETWTMNIQSSPVSPLNLSHYLKLCLLRGRLKALSPRRMAQSLYTTKASTGAVKMFSSPPSNENYSYQL